MSQMPRVHLTWVLDHLYTKKTMLKDSMGTLKNLALGSYHGGLLRPCMGPCLGATSHSLRELILETELQQLPHPPPASSLYTVASKEVEP
jgi:hypothetical protein